MSPFPLVCENTPQQTQMKARQSIPLFWMISFQDNWVDCSSVIASTISANSHSTRALFGSPAPWSKAMSVRHVTSCRTTYTSWARPLPHPTCHVQLTIEEIRGTGKWNTVDRQNKRSGEYRESSMPNPKVSCTFHTKPKHPRFCDIG